LYGRGGQVGQKDSRNFFQVARNTATVCSPAYLQGNSYRINPQEETWLFLVVVSAPSKVTGLNRPFPRKVTVDNPVLSSSLALSGQKKMIHSCMNSA